MSSMLCQELQSCFQPRFVEPQPIGFKMAATSSTINPVPGNKNNDGVDSNNTKRTKCGWSLIESLTTSSQTLKNDKANDEPPYVHPLVKRYASKLSDKSLELCTESLGSESGSDIGEDSDFYSSSSSDSENEKSAAIAPQKTRHNSGTFTNKRVDNSASFPPPLSSISGSNSIQVKPHRENGRLVIRTVAAASRPQACFQAERRDGRLTLRFTEDSTASAVESRLEEAVKGEIHGQEIEEEEEDAVEARNGQEEKGGEMEIEKEETDGNWYNVGGEMGTEKFHLRSCKESRQEKNENSSPTVVYTVVSTVESSNGAYSSNLARTISQCFSHCPGSIGFSFGGNHGINHGCCSITQERMVC